MIKHLILDLLTADLVVIIGLLNYRKLNLFYRLLTLQAFIYIIVDVTGVFAGLNAWLFNLQIPVESILLFSAAQAYFKSEMSKRVLLILFAVLLAVFFWDVFWLCGIRNIAYHTLIVEGLFLSGIYMLILSLQFMKENVKSVDSALVIASTGMILYFAVSIPYFSAMPFFEEDPTQNQQLFTSIVVKLGNLRYLFIAIALFISARSKKQSPTFF